MKNLGLFLAITFLVCCNSQPSGNQVESGWSLVYQHDEQGEGLFGDKGKVVEAVRNGLSIKVGYGIQVNEERSIEHIAEAQFLSVINVKDTVEVFAQISPIMRQGPFRLGDTIGIKLVPGYKWLTAIGTNGMCSNVMVNNFADSIHGSNERRRAAMWFVEYPPNFADKNKSTTLLHED